jgi:hypothetical protein
VGPSPLCWTPPGPQQEITGTRRRARAAVARMGSRVYSARPDVNEQLISLSAFAPVARTDEPIAVRPVVVLVPCNVLLCRT